MNTVVSGKITLYEIYGSEYTNGNKFCQVIGNHYETFNKNDQVSFHLTCVPVSEKPVEASAKISGKSEMFIFYTDDKM